jgi:arylformamidase
MTRRRTDRRVVFDFEIDFLNEGGIQGQAFRLDIDDADIPDEQLADYIIRDLGLLMVGEVRILNKQIIRERHKRDGASATNAERAGVQLVDLSHTIEHGMTTYPGLPGPVVCDYLSREASQRTYAAGTEFQIGKIEMVANTGTYLDSPFHRYADGVDIADLDLASLTELDAIVIRTEGMAGQAIDRPAVAHADVEGKAVLVHSGWDARWRTPQYFEGHPHLTHAAAEYLRDHGAALVGIDSLNIDDTRGGERPVHSTLLAGGIPIVEHLRSLAEVPTSGFRFSAIPPKVRGMGTFPVRACAAVPYTT